MIFNTSKLQRFNINPIRNSVHNPLLLRLEFLEAIPDEEWEFEGKFASPDSRSQSLSSSIFSNSSALMEVGKLQANGPVYSARRREWQVKVGVRL